MKTQYSQLFDTSKNFDDKIFYGGVGEGGNCNTPKLTLVRPRVEW